jgi:hypothetical protein
MTTSNCMMHLCTFRFAYLQAFIILTVWWSGRITLQWRISYDTCNSTLVLFEINWCRHSHRWRRRLAGGLRALRRFDSSRSSLPSLSLPFILPPYIAFAFPISPCHFPPPSLLRRRVHAKPSPQSLLRYPRACPHLPYCRFVPSSTSSLTSSTSH